MKDYAQNSVEVTKPIVGSHTMTAKIIHWGFLGVFIYAISKQVDEVEELENFALLQEEMIFAIVFLLLLLARFIYMHSTVPTLLPSDTPRRIMLLAQTVHLGMYVSLAMIAVSGLMIGGLYWSGIKEGTLMASVLILHEIVFWTSINLIGLHVAGAIYHRRQRDGVWNAMVPGRAEEVGE